MRAIVVMGAGGCCAGAVLAQSPGGAAGPIRGLLLQNMVLWGGVPLLLAAAGIFLVLALRPRRANASAGWGDAGAGPLVVALLAALSIGAVAAYTTYYTAAKLRQDAWLRYQVEVDRLEEGLKRQFDSMTPALRGLRSAAAIGGRLDAQQLAQWVAAGELEQAFPGVLGLGVVPVARDAVRLDELQLRGAILFEPAPLQAPLGALPWKAGSDLHSTLLRAVRSGRPALSAAVPLQHRGESVQAVVVMLPIYASAGLPPTPERRLAQASAVAIGVLQLDDFLAGLDAASHGLLAFEVRDSIDTFSARLVYHSDWLTDNTTSMLFDETRNVLLGQRFLQLRAVSTPEFERSIDAHVVGYIAAGGATLSVLLGLVVWLLMAGRARALARARMLTRDVERLALVAERTSNAVVITDPQERITWVNDGFTRITGYTAQEALGMRPKDFLQSPRTDPKTRAELRKALDRGNACRARILNTGKGGREYWLDVEIQPQRDRTGRLIGFMAIEQDVTEQVLAAEALRRERERADGILLGSNVGTWQVNLQTGETLVNEQWSRMMGFEPADVGPDVKTFWESRVRPEDLVRVGNLLEACRSGVSQRYETDVRVMHKRGHWIWIMSRAVVMSHDTDGRPEWIAGIHMDVTDQRRSEEGLRDMQAFLNRSGRAAKVGAWEMDIRTGVIKWSEQTCEIHGVDHGYLPTRDEALSFYDDAGRTSLLAAMDEAPLTLRGWDVTLPFTDRQGRSKWVRNVGEVEFDDSGPVRLVGAFQDVTDLRSTEMQVKKTSSMLQSVLDSAVQVGVIATNLDRVITVFNKGAERMLGYSADELVNKETASRFFALEQLAVIQETLTLEQGHAPDAAEVFAYVVSHPELNEWTFVRKDQTRLTVQFLISPMFDHAGHAVGYLGIAQDITLQKQQEQVLREAKAQAEAASVAKSQFLANMSHEIRTPMNAILGMLRLLQNTPLSPKQKDYAQKTLGAAKSLLGLLNDILDFSKVEAGKLQLDPHPFLLDDLLADMSVILSSNLGTKPVDIIFDIDPALPRQMMGDALRLKQVLINLGGNALKFTAQGHVALVWTCLGSTGNRVRSRIEVRDTGIGIAPENQAKIFDGFSQAEASTTRKYGGTGLGLAISQRLIRLLGSELSLRSTLGEGSCFSFELDLPVVPDAPGDWQGAPTAAVRVLVVDDDEDSRVAIARAASGNGWTVDTAADAAQALARLALDAGATGAVAGYDLVLIDERMPGMDGWQLFARLRELGDGEALPRCVLMSTKGPELVEAQHAPLSAQLDGYVVKPLTSGMLERAWSQALRRDGAASVTPSDTSSERLGGMRILVVEDNPINQQVARELLSAEGAQVTLADNGLAGVEALREAPQAYDVVLMDMQMPVMDGLTATRAIRTELGLGALPVIAMTANAMVSDREACLEAGMNDHVGKPFDLNHLVQTLCKFTGRQSVGAPAVSMPPPSFAGPMAQASQPWAADVDVASALERMAGMQDLYRDTLQAFLPEAQALPGQVRAALAAADPELARRSVHSFKGLSATVGVEALQQRAAELEAHLKSLPPVAADIESALQRLVAELARLKPVLESLLQSLGGKPAAAGAFEDTAPGFVSDLQHLAMLAQAEDLEALQAHADLVARAPEKLREALEPIGNALAGLDFAVAQAECALLIGSLQGKH